MHTTLIQMLIVLFTIVKVQCAWWDEIKIKEWEKLIVDKDLKSFKLGDGRGKHRRVRMADESQQESQPARKERKIMNYLPFSLKILEIVSNDRLINFKKKNKKKLKIKRERIM